MTLTDHDLVLASKIGSRDYAIRDVDRLLDFAEARRETLAEAYAYWASTVATLKGEKAAGKTEAEIVAEAAMYRDLPKKTKRGRMPSYVKFMANKVYR